MILENFLYIYLLLPQQSIVFYERTHGTDVFDTDSEIDGEHLEQLKAIVA